MFPVMWPVLSELPLNHFHCGVLFRAPAFSQPTTSQNNARPRSSFLSRRNYINCLSFFCVYLNVFFLSLSLIYFSQLTHIPYIRLTLFAQYHNQGKEFEKSLKYLNMGFTGMFSVETILKIIGFGVKVGIFGNG